MVTNPSNTTFSFTGGAGSQTSPSRLRRTASAIDTTNVGTIPKLNNFDGKEGGKNEYPYRRWVFDVKQLRKVGYSEEVIRMSIIRSCRGVAADILQTLKEDFTVEDVTAAFDKRFASVATSEAMLSTFYSAKQKNDESANSWGCRLESWLASPQLSHLDSDQKHSMLRERFWRGLKSDIHRNALRHKFDSGCHYDELLVVAREIELESGAANQKEKQQKTSNSKAKVGAQTAVKPGKKNMQATLDDILARLTALETRLPPAAQQGKTPSSAGRGRAVLGRAIGNRGRGQSGSKRGRGQATQGFTDSQKTSTPRSRIGNTVGTSDTFGKCFNCGESGHFRSSCPLN